MLAVITRARRGWRHAWARTRAFVVLARRHLARARDGLMALRASVWRERIACASAYALIAAFGVTSMDYLITSGPQWNIGAAAAAAEPRFSRAAPAAPADGEEIVLIAGPAAIAEPELFYSAAVSADDLLGGPRFAYGEASYQPAAYTQDAPDGPAPTMKPATATPLLVLASAQFGKAHRP